MKKLVAFVKESIAELKKVVWPSKEDVISSVKVVIISTLVFAIILGLVDALLLLGVRPFFKGIAWLLVGTFFIPILGMRIK